MVFTSATPYIFQAVTVLMWYMRVRVELGLAVCRLAWPKSARPPRDVEDGLVGVLLLEPPK